MRRLLGSAQSVEAVGPRMLQRPHICRSCHHQIFRQRFLPLQSSRSKSSNLPFTERLRRKIWGTDNPPGLEDPYGGPGYFERRRQRQRGERGAQEGREIPAPQSAPIDSSEPVLNESAPWRSVPIDDPELVDPAYVPAETWDGLEHVGSSGDWREIPVRVEEEFEPFISMSDKATTQEDFLSSTHQAMVEVLTLKASTPSLPSSLGNITYTPDALATISNTTIELNENGRDYILGYENGGQEIILDAIGNSIDSSSHASSQRSEDAGALLASSDAGQDRKEEVKEDLQKRSHTHEDALDPLLLSEQEVNEPHQENGGGSINGFSPRKRSSYTVNSLDFLSLPLECPKLRFLAIKRVSQLTGHRIPDPVLTSSQTLMPVYDHLMKEKSQKPKKVADQVLASQDFVSLPNVHFMSRRETPVDREKRVGRWKVIEAELNSKGLPVLSKPRLA